MPGKHQVEDHEIGVVLGVELDRLWPVGGDDDVVALALEPRPHGFGDRFLVVDDQDGLFAHARIVVRACVARLRVRC